MRNANDDSKRNSKELQPKIDDALRRAERHGKGANIQGVPKLILTILTEVFLQDLMPACACIQILTDLRYI